MSEPLLFSSNYAFDWQWMPVIGDNSEIIYLAMYMGRYQGVPRWFIAEKSAAAPGGFLFSEVTGEESEKYVWAGGDLNMATKRNLTKIMEDSWDENQCQCGRNEGDPALCPIQGCFLVS